MPDFGEIYDWMGKHPYATGGIIVVGGLGILYLLGFFDKAQASGDQGQTNMAAAYYAAEAAQAAAGAQIQGISLVTTAQTSQTKIAADAATAINAQNTFRDVTVNQQNTGSANTIAAIGGTVGLADISGQVQQTRINADAATSQNASNNLTAAQIAKITTDAANVNTALQTIVPQELAMSGGFGNFSLPGQGGFTVNTGAFLDPDQLRALGFGPNQVDVITQQQIASGRFQ